MRQNSTYRGWSDVIWRKQGKDRSNSAITASVMSDLGNIGYFFHYLTVSLRLATVIPLLHRSVTYRIFVYIEFLQHSLTVDFPPLYSLWQNDGHITRVKSWFACRWRTLHEVLKTGYVHSYRLLPRETEATQHERSYQVLHVLYRALRSVRTVYISTTTCGFYFDYRTT